MPDTVGDKDPVSMGYLNEVKTSLESSMDTKLSRLENQLETLTALLNSVLDKGTPAVVVEEVGDPSLAVANKTAVDGEDDPKNLKLIPPPPNLEMEVENIVVFLHLYLLILV